MIVTVSRKRRVLRQTTNVAAEAADHVPAAREPAPRPRDELAAGAEVRGDGRGGEVGVGGLVELVAGRDGLVKKSFFWKVDFF